MFLWWVEARSASEVVPVAVGGSGGLAHVVSRAQVIPCVVCRSTAGNAAHPHWPHTTKAVARLESLRSSKGILIEPPSHTASECQCVKPW